MEESDMTDTDRIVLKGDTALCLHLLQLVQRLEVTIGDSSLVSGQRRSQGCSSGE
jgi:hypothetical protein